MGVFVNGKSVSEKLITDIHTTSGKTEVYGETYPYITTLGVIDGDPSSLEVSGNTVTTTSAIEISSFQVDFYADGPNHLESIRIDLSWRSVVSGLGSADFWWEWADSSNPTPVFTRLTDIITLSTTSPSGETISRYGQFKGSGINLLPITFRMMGRVSEVGTTLQTYLSNSCELKHVVKVD